MRSPACSRKTKRYFFAQFHKTWGELLSGKKMGSSEQDASLISTSLSCTAESFNLLFNSAEAVVDALNLFLHNFVIFWGPAHKSQNHAGAFMRRISDCDCELTYSLHVAIWWGGKGNCAAIFASCALCTRVRIMKLLDYFGILMI